MNGTMIRVCSCPERGSIYREPVSGFSVPFEGVDVVDSPFWQRRIKAGDVLLIPSEDEPEQEASSPDDNQTSGGVNDNQQSESFISEIDVSNSGASEETKADEAAPETSTEEALEVTEPTLQVQTEPELGADAQGDLVLNATACEQVSGDKTEAKTDEAVQKSGKRGKGKTEQTPA